MGETVKTVRVRIAVVVRSDGSYLASGNNDSTDATNARCADFKTYDAQTKHVVFVEADVPLPAPLTIEGTVTRG